MNSINGKHSAVSVETRLRKIELTFKSVTTEPNTAFSGY